jgi:hypothetical protein
LCFCGGPHALQPAAMHLLWCTQPKRPRLTLPRHPAS